MTNPAWLAPVRSALDSAEGVCPVFFRDDDAGWEDDALARLLDLFEQHRVPVDVAVIPDALHPALAKQLQGRAEGGIVHLHQHGYRHQNHQPQGRKCEFGDARRAGQQATDIAAGWVRLTDALGPACEAVFTPPWNRCDQTTAHVLEQLGFSALSRDLTASRLHSGALRQLPITVDWFGRNAGQRWDLAERGLRIAASLSGQRLTGVMLHHGVTDAEDLGAIAELIELVGAHPQAACTHLSELARSL